MWYRSYPDRYDNDYLGIYVYGLEKGELPIPYSIAKETRERCDCARSRSLSLSPRSHRATLRRRKPFLASGRYHQLVYSSDA